MNKPKEQTFADYMRELHIVPVSISYEWDPLDAHKARELYAQKHEGGYVKGKHEDVVNLAKGIAGVKGSVHIAFGDELTQNFADAEEMAAEIDRQIINNYVLHPSNCIAYQSLYDQLPPVSVGHQQLPFTADAFRAEAKLLADRLRAIEPKHRAIVRAMYANPIVSKLEFNQGLPAKLAS